MDTSHHFTQRMSQRGVSREMVNLVRDHGVLDGDKVILGRRDAARLIDQLMEQLRVLRKIQDKGGLVVVESGETLVTTYNFHRRVRH